MLALAHPTEARTIDGTGVDRNISSLPRTTSSSSSGRSSSSRVPHWKPQAPTSTAVFQSSSSYCPRRSISVSSVVAKESSPTRQNTALSSQATSESSSRVPPPDNPPRAGSPIPPPQISIPTSASSFDVHNYPSTDLLRLLASLLTQIASTNDVISGSDPASHTLAGLSHNNISEDVSRSPIWRSLTSASRSSLSNPASALTFHARNIPTIALESYLLRILKYCPTTNEVFLALLVYFDRMSRLASEATGRTFVIDSYNVHRLVIAGVTVASKFFSDVFYTNSRYAKVGFKFIDLFKIFTPSRISLSLLRSEVFLKQSSTNSNSSFYYSTTLGSLFRLRRCKDMPNSLSSSHNHSHQNRLPCAP